MPNLCRPCRKASESGKHVAHSCIDPACTCSSCISRKIRRRAQQRRDASAVHAGAGIHHEVGSVSLPLAEHR